MSPTIEDFDGVVWSLDSIGPEVADPAIVHRIESEVLPAGRPAVVVRDQAIVWLRREDVLHREFLAWLRSEDGLAYSDFAALSEEPCRIVREAEIRIAEKSVDMFRAKPAPFSFEVGPRSPAQHIAMMNTPLPPAIWKGLR